MSIGYLMVVDVIDVVSIYSFKPKDNSPIPTD